MLTKNDLQIIREYFSENEWDLIDSALSEYQDHYDADDQTDTYDGLQSKLAGLFRLTK